MSKLAWSSSVKSQYSFAEMSSDLKHSHRVREASLSEPVLENLRKCTEDRRTGTGESLRTSTDDLRAHTGQSRITGTGLSHSSY
eukprot:3425076-Rhodomonas_salina.1